MLTIPHCKESLSRAYITAVVGRSRNNLSLGSTFDYGVDGTVKQLKRRGHRIMESGFSFDFQAKSSIDWSINGSDVVYDLEVKAYNDLVARAGTGAIPYYLILLCLSPKNTDWLRVSADRLILRQLAVYHRISGPPSNNQYTHRIRIPSQNILRPGSVRRILRGIEAGSIVP